ncbi:XrtA/PEP-CTERM system-associated ATPase [Thiohalomonas denitrificans]|uniref:Putative secretion ATPase, PEP-CTERM locus subfamily n=1 Tax=Thiohalomonas denitrificans TaxID=415747 RepID=A0A1G5Q2J2_9GAMM|nr:XrtA/PEP-CTERM system-associated ATPase [Thiohalomonas denitrificans]SCZ55887.1 putative secretion ATPase, PEP-CTERM locus subfamily [Thiohalomonas denitrificans]
MYETFYGLNGKPFSLSPDPNFYFASRGHQRVLSYLRYGIHQGEGFVVVTGEIGAGKTTLIKTLVNELSGDTDFVIGQIASTQLEASDLAESVALAFGVSNEGLSRSQIFNRLQGYLTQRRLEGKRALLIVDEAQNMPYSTLEELRMLTNHQVGDRQMLQACLVGQGELRARLQEKRMEQLRQRAVAFCHLGPMSQEETQGYIKHRLQRVGWKGRPELHQDALDSIYSETQGIPRRINTLADRIFLVAYLEEKEMVDRDLVTEVARELAEEQPSASDESEAALAGTQKMVSGQGEELMEQRLSAVEERMGSLEKLMDCRSLAKALIQSLQRT